MPIVMMMKGFKNKILDIITFWSRLRYINIQSLNWIQVEKVDNNKVIIFSRTTPSGDIYWSIVNISWATTLTFWSNYELESTWLLLRNQNVIRLEDNKFLFTYSTSLMNWSIRCKIITVTWNTISLWPTFFLTSNYWNVYSPYKLDTNKVIIWNDHNGWINYHPWLRILTITWDTITSWSFYQADTSTNWQTWNSWIVLIDENKIFFTYRLNSDWNNLYWIVGTISWTVITYWTRVKFFNQSWYNVSIKYLDVNKVLIIYNTTSWVNLYWVVATISWTTITYWTEFLLETFISWPKIEFINSSYFLISYIKNNALYFMTINVSWDTIGIIYNTNITGATEYSITRMENDSFCVAYKKYSDSYWYSKIVKVIWYNIINDSNETVFSINNNTNLYSIIKLMTNKIFIWHRDWTDNWNWYWIAGIIN